MARMKWLALLLLTGCGSVSDGVLLRGEPLSSLPDAWFSWRTEEPKTNSGNPSVVTAATMTGSSGLVIYLDGRAEAVLRRPAWPSMGSRTTRLSGSISAADRAELEKALAGPLAAPDLGKREPLGDLEPDTEGGGSYVVEVRVPDGAPRRLSYEHLRWSRGESGGEPLHPLIMRILRALSE